jgi:hypothetical protein
MQRLVEQPTDEGVIYKGTARIGRVHYHLAVYQHFAEPEGNAVGAHVEVEGHIAPIDPVDVAALPPHASEYTLHLADGRLLDFTIATSAGKIRSTGRGLYSA